ncbi:thioredoxin-like protein CITRX, chloroplastic isoform X2 [Argentina anserina]|uniref:thioredoxin-like protein CITRX, chloroplastic isoform X2 n=1 Tax=Argentina anserina TaxID=57926 RepID=UPI0021763826|nr:thioredoxin-like protein CITRX, chloroplastic isoform X2 [Potentilla anserina]
MALLHAQTSPHIHSHSFSSNTHSHSPVLLSFQSPPAVSFFSLKTHHQNSLFSKNSPSSLSTTPRKVLCRPPHGKHVRQDYLVEKISAQEVQELVKGDRNVPLVVDFFATWCGPCILMAQELEMVRGLPTLLFISPDPSKDAIRTEGLIPLQMMRDIIDNEL